jgi:hypothetical protein
MMRTKIQFLVFSLFVTALAAGQPGGGGGMQSGMSNQPDHEHSNDSTLNIHDRLWAWQMIDDYTFVDSVAVDTMTTNFHNYDPIYIKSFSNIYLGNKGSAYVSNLMSFKPEVKDFIFVNNMQMHFVQPKDLLYFNTKVPYTNLAYKNSGPSNRSEENFSAFFTQNVNKDWNIAFRFDLVSTIGLYENQQVDNRSFNLYSSYEGPKYSSHAALIYNSIEHEENGGLDDDDYTYITDPDYHGIYDAEDIPVKYYDSKQKIQNFQLFYNHSLGIGKIKIKKNISDSLYWDQSQINIDQKMALQNNGFSNDSLINEPLQSDSLKNNMEQIGAKKNESQQNGSLQNGPQQKGPPNSSAPQRGPQENGAMNKMGQANRGHQQEQAPQNGTIEEEQLPVSTLYHSLNLGTYSHKYIIDDLDDYADDDYEIPLYDNIYADSLETKDSTSYYFVNNTFQIKFNEEANSLLKFGLRAFVANDIEHYKYQLTTEYEDDTAVYRHNDTTFITTYIGGQVFKNLGKNFWWNIGGKICVQGYKLGDIDLYGNINSLYKVFNDTAGIYARTRLRLRTANLLEEKYYSNHFIWNNNFRQEKTVNIEIGLNIPTRRLKLSWENKVFTDYIYWNYDAVPEQTSEVINAFQLTLQKDFVFGPFHSDNKLAYQNSTNQEVFSLPDFTAYSSNYFNFYLAKKVLQVQAGLDVRYHTEYYTPAYMPATGQFYQQNDQKVGNYPFMDAFFNFQLKRARIFVKLDHFNQTLLDRNYFLTKAYPYAPMRIKWGVSWNFYD